MTDTKPMKMKSNPPDGGWGWLIVLGSFINGMIGAGSLYSVGVLYATYLDAFGKSKAVTAWIGSIYSVCFCGSCSLGLAIAHKIGHRKTVMLSGLIATCGVFSSAFATELYHLYFTYGIVAGCSLGLTYTTGIEMISLYFKHRLTIAVGFGLAGTGAGQLTLSPLTQFLVETYGWRGTMMILAGLVAHVCVAGALFRPPAAKVDTTPNETAQTENVYDETNCSHSDIGIQVDIDLEQDTENGNKTHESEDHVTQPTVALQEDEPQKRQTCCSSVLSFLKLVIGLSVLKDPICQILVLLSLGFGLSQFIVLIHMVRRGRDFGIGDTQSAYIPAVMGLAQLIGRPLSGALGHSPQIKAHVVFGVCLALCGILTASSTYITTFIGQLCFIGCFGITMGGYIVYVPLVAAEFLGQKDIGPGTSLMVQAQGIVALASGPFAGWIRDIYGVYDIAFWVAGSIFMVVAIVSLTLPSIDKLLKKKSAEHRRQTQETCEEKI